MKLNIVSVKDRGILDKERLLLRAQGDGDVGAFCLLRVVVVNKGATTGLRSAYWFPDKKVRSGDLVVLYSKRGGDTEKVNEDGSTSHFFYWHLSSPAWGGDDDGATLLSISSWKFYFPAAESQQELPLPDEAKASERKVGPGSDLR